MNQLWQTLMNSDVVHRLGWMLAYSIGLGSAVAGLLAASQLILRRRSANARYVASVTAMVAIPMLTMASWFFIPADPHLSPIAMQSIHAENGAPVNVGQASAPDFSKSAIPVVAQADSSPMMSDDRSTAVEPPTASRPVSPRLWIRASRAIDPLLPRVVPVWAVGVLTLALWQLCGWAASQRIRWQSPKPRNEATRAILRRLADRMNIRTPVELYESTKVRVPSVIGWLRPAILLPIGLASGLTSSQLEAILAHELAHVRRHDYVVNLVQTLVETLLFYHPAMWYVSGVMRAERENCCDDLAIRYGAEPLAYAESLLRVAERAIAGRDSAISAPALALGATGKASALRRRVRRMLGARDTVSSEGWPAAILIVLAMGGATVLYSVGSSNAAGPAADGAPARPQEAPTANGSATLPDDKMENLKWGEPVNGLRAAVAFRKLPDKSGANDLPELYLAIQNVSDRSIHLTDVDVPANVNLRMLDIKSDGRIQAGLGTREPALGDLTLQPREIALSRVFGADSNASGGHTVGQLMAEDALKDTHQTFGIEMTIDKAPAGAWTGKVVTGDSTGAQAAGQPQPKSKEAQALFNVWRHLTRENGNFPGGLLGLLGDKVKEFIHNNTGDAGGDPYAKKMAPILPRIDPSRDWTAEEMVALMDDIAAVTPIPLETSRDEMAQSTFKTAQPLPKELADAPWGDAQPDGLRMAWLVAPHSAEYPIGTALKSRVLIQNAGKEVVVFRTRQWHQLNHTARDANGAEIKVDSTSWLTRGLLASFRLWPGEYIEVNAPGIGVGARQNDEDAQNARVGSWIEAKAGDTVTLTTVPLPLGDWNEKTPENGEPAWWLKFITTRLRRELPMPTDASERKHMVYRAGMDLFGTPLSAAEIEAFVSDAGPDALENLAKRLAHRAGTSASAGGLTSGQTIFRVLPADPNAAKKPRTAADPGHYTLAPNAVLVVSRRPEGERIVNEASIQFPSPDEKRAVNSYQLKLPDGYGTWAASWIRGGSVLWVNRQGHIHGYDYSNPEQVKETSLDDPASLEKVPQSIRDALQSAAKIPVAPKGPPAATPKKDKGAAAPPPAGQLQSANHIGKYELGAGRALYLCQQGATPKPFFSVLWPASADLPKRDVRIFPGLAKGAKYAVVFQPGTDVLWWVDDGDIGKVQFENAAHVMVDRRERGQSLSHEFGLTEEVRAEFHKLGFEIGRDKTDDEDVRAGRNIGRREILVAGPLDGPARESVDKIDAKIPDKSPAGAAPTGVGIDYADLKDEVEWNKDGGPLYLGIHVVGDKWTIGSELPVELWACNPGDDDVKFARNGRTDVGLAVIARDKDGKDHFGHFTSWDAYPVFDHVRLPAGHVMKLKEFTVKFDVVQPEKPDRGIVTLDLPPGAYTLRCKWSDSNSVVAQTGEWSGVLTTAAHKFTLTSPVSGTHN